MYLILTAFLFSFVNANSTILGKPFLKWMNRSTTKEKELLAVKIQLIKEQSEISMMDNFAKHARLQRRINSIDQELSEIKVNKSSSTVYAQLFFNYGIKVIFGLILVLLTIYFRKTPVFHLQNNINLFPFSHLISYPNERNSVSFHFWVMCCSAVARLIKIS